MEEGWLTKNLKDRKFRYMYYTELFFEVILSKIEDWERRVLSFLDRKLKD